MVPTSPQSALIEPFGASQTGEGRLGRLGVVQGLDEIGLHLGRELSGCDQSLGTGKDIVTSARRPGDASEETTELRGVSFFAMVQANDAGGPAALFERLLRRARLSCGATQKTVSAAG